MAAFIAENMAPIMFVALVVFLLLGYPVAFSLGAVGLLFFVIAVELAPLSNGVINLSWPLLQSLPDRIYGVMSNETLLAVPFFTFMGLILERSGMAEDLLDTIGQLFGTVRGGLAYAVIFVGALLAATTGIVAALVISMGLISLPIMLRYGYDRRVATGVIAASGTLAQIIPPSLVLIVMADQLGRSVGDMYEGAFIPGAVLACMYAAYIFLVTVVWPKAAPGLPVQAVFFKEENPVSRDRLARINALLLLASVLIAAGYVAHLLYTEVQGATKSSSAGDYVMSIIYLALFTALLKPLKAIVISLLHGGDERGLLSLGFLIVLSSAVGWYTMHDSGYKVADFIILCMSVTIVVAFGVALLNWLLIRTTGARFLSHMAQQVTFAMMPPLFLIFLVLGTLFAGIATPTEGGAMGAVGAMLLALTKRIANNEPLRFNTSIVRSAAEATAKLSSFVMFILIGARIFSLTFYGVNGHTWVEHLLTSLPGGQIGFLVFVNLIVFFLVFFLAFFLDFFELAFIIVPLLVAPAEKLGIDLIWFGVILGVNMQTSFMHPPFGFALFFLRSVAPRAPYIDRVTGLRMEPVTTGQIYWGAVPFVIIQCIMVITVISFPIMVMHYKGGNVPAQKGTIELPALGGMLPGGEPGSPQGGPAGWSINLSNPPSFDFGPAPPSGDKPAPAAPAPRLDLRKPPSFD